MDAELYKPFKLIFSVFRTLGMWQDGNQTWVYFIFGYLFHFVIIEVFGVAVLLFAFKIKNLDDFVDVVGLMATQTAEMFKCLNFFYKIKNIKKSIKTLTSLLEFSADERWNSRDYVKSQVAFGYKVLQIFWITAWATCISAAFVPFFAHKLPYKVWFPFDTENSEIGFWIASTFLTFLQFALSVIDVAVDILPVMFMTFGIGLINELSNRLSELGKPEKNENNLKEKLEMEKDFIKCIEIHRKINEFVKEIHGNFSTVILIQGLISSLILCTCAFTLSTVSYCLFVIHSH
jgi:7tm Odorant receptor